MKERWTEIQFYFFMQRLLKVFDEDVTILDFIDAICLLCRANSLIIKKYIRQIREGHGTIIAPIEEVVLFARQAGISYRQLYKATGISTSTQYRYRNDTSYVDVNYKTGQDYIEIERFMKTIKKIEGAMML